VEAARAHSLSGRQADSSYNLTFGGGLGGIGVTTGAPRVYLVFWGSQWGTRATNAGGYATFSGDPKGMAPDLQAFFKGLGTNGETWSGVMTQYCQGVAMGAQTCPIFDPHVGYPAGGALAGVWADTVGAAPISASAHQLAVEAVSAAAHFGNTTAAANRNAQYVVVSPTSALPDGFDAGGGFCAWHDYTADPTLDGGGAAASPTPVAFTNLPYVSDATLSCGMNFVNKGVAGTLDGVTIVAGHEYAETITDQFPVGGWLDSAGAENGDKCAWITLGQGATENLALTTGVFAVQSTWANDFGGGAGSCVVSHSIVVTNVSNTAPAITSYQAASFNAGYPSSFTVSASGFPIPAITGAGALPPGVILTDNHDGSATVSGSAAVAQGGTFPMTLSAANGVGANATQGFTLTVVPWSPTIVNFAGIPTGVTAQGGDGGPAATAELRTPDPAVDSAGNVYIADGDYNRVRKVGADGIINNFAGDPNGYGGYSGDGGPATSARLNEPVAVAVDPVGNVFIVDVRNNRVRKVDAYGIITTVAGNGTYGNTGDGGPATAASMSPSDMAVDSNDNIYIVDDGNSQIRKVDANGIITNFAGSPLGYYGGKGNTGDGGPAVLAQLYAPQGVTVDRAGNVYIADTGNERIRKVDPNGIITNFAGDPSGAAGSSGDGGPAGSATLDNPRGLSVDAEGEVFVATSSYPGYDNNRIRKVDMAGTISTFAGDSSGTFFNYGGNNGPADQALLFGPSATAVDGAGNVYIADDGRIREVLAGPAIISFASATFAVGAAGSFTVAVTGIPAPILTESGTLPAGATFSGAARTLTWTPPQGSTGTYLMTVRATDGLGTDASQSFTMTVNQATMTYPTNGQAKVDVTKPFTWSTIPEAQRYILTVGTTLYGADLVNSGVLPPNQSNLAVPVLPAGATLFATLYAEVNGSWTSYQAITFTAAPALGTFIFPLNGQTGVDPTRPFKWNTIPQAQGYLLVVGTKKYGSDLLFSGVLDPSFFNYSAHALPSGKTLYATLLTKVNGVFSEFQAISFSARPAVGVLTRPANGQLNVTTPTTFTWSTLSAAQNYYLVVGTTVNGKNLVDSGLLPGTQSSMNIPALPHGKLLYATLLTRVDSHWVFQQAGFTAG
jgi:serine protease